ncbi:hypothetical protein LXL04_007864 [Taraxacum kok-saghyz]
MLKLWGHMTRSLNKWVKSQVNGDSNYFEKTTYHLPHLKIFIKLFMIEHWRLPYIKVSKSFENSYIFENPITSKPLTFSKNRLRELKIAQIQGRSQNFFFRKNDFFFKNFAYKKKLHICKKIKKKSCTYAKIKKKKSFFVKKFLRPGLYLSDFYPPEVGFSKKLTVWEFSGMDVKRRQTLMMLKSRSRKNTICKIKQKISWIHRKRWPEIKRLKVNHRLRSFPEVNAPSFRQHQHSIEHLEHPA